MATLAGGLVFSASASAQAGRGFLSLHRRRRGAETKLAVYILKKHDPQKAISNSDPNGTEAPPIDDDHCWRKEPLFSAKALARIVQLGPVSNHVGKLIESLNARAICDIFIRCEAPVKLAFLVDDDGPG
jgi:hypothetical protein